MQCRERIKKDKKLQLEFQDFYVKHPVFQDFYVKHPVRTIHKPIILYISDTLVTLNIGNTFTGTFFPSINWWDFAIASKPGTWHNRLGTPSDLVWSESLISGSGHKMNNQQLHLTYFSQSTAGERNLHPGKGEQLKPIEN